MDHRQAPALTVMLVLGCGGGNATPPQEGANEASSGTDAVPSADGPSDAVASVEDPRFEAIVPAGFQLELEAPAVEDAVTLVRVAPQGIRRTLRSSILVRPLQLDAALAASGTEVDTMSDAARCHAEAEQARRELAAEGSVSPEPMGDQLVNVGDETACQFELRLPDPERPRSMLDTVLRRGDGTNVEVVCMMADDDVGAREGCQQFLRSFRWASWPAERGPPRDGD